MKIIILGAIVAIGLALAFGGNSNGDAQGDSRLQQGVDHVDTYLQKGLTPETHQIIAEKASSSADWLKGFQAQLQQKVNDTAQ